MYYPSSPTAEQEAKPVRPRKPYTITKQREVWTEEEHAKFLEALKIHNRDWKKIEEYVGTKSVKQIRSHAQKYFLKIQRAGNPEAIPPPRPKKRSAQPYPTGTKPESSSSVSPASSSETLGVVPAFNHWMGANGLSTPGGAFPPPPPLLGHDSATSAFSRDGLPPHSPATPLPLPPRATPNFAKIYAFLGSLFDPNTSNHVQALDQMSPIDRETVQILMNNLSLNLATQHIQDQHALMFQQYRNLSRPPDHAMLPSMQQATGGFHAVSPKADPSFQSYSSFSRVSPRDSNTTPTSAAVTPSTDPDTDTERGTTDFLTQ